MTLIPRRLVAVGAVALMVIALLGIPGQLGRPGPTPSATHDMTAMAGLIGQLRTDYPEIYDADGVAGSSDDLTEDRLDLILEGADAEDAATDVVILGQATTLLLDLTATSRGSASGGDPICPDALIDLSSDDDAQTVFGEARPDLATVVGNVIGAWTGTLTDDGRDWTFGYPAAQADTVAITLSGIATGRMVVDDGCAG